jgi:hypothetical protein
VKTTAERIEAYYLRGCIASVEEAIALIEYATEYGISAREVGDAHQYIIDKHAVALVPAWIARACATFEQSGDCHE